MLKPLRWLLWTALFLGMLLAIDQFFVHVPPAHPAHAAVSRFYLDFRTRLFAMTFGTAPADAPQSIDAIIDRQQGDTAPSRPPHQAQRYIYADARGELQFADSLEDVPPQYRAQAQPMGQ